MYITILSSTILFLATLTHAATTTTGPSGYVSIVSQPAFSTIRPCAAGCLWYTGSFACGVNKGYYDLAQELQCGCSAKNLCYCGQNNLAPASAYISSCVSKGCSNFPGQVTSAISAFDGYCATANVETSSTAGTGGSNSVVKSGIIGASTTQIQVGATGVATTTGVGNTVTGTGSAGSQSAATGTGEGGKPSPTSSASPEKKGLAQSDIIALAVGLGVGVPSLLLALATFCVQRRSKNRKSMALAG